jgi:replicative DNA helicase
MRLETTVEPFAERLPPYAIDAEMCCLAALLLAGAESALFAETKGLLSRDAFFQSDHQILFDVICETAQRRKAIDYLILREELIKRQLLEEVGGVSYLAELANCLPSAAHGPHYAQIVAEKGMLRNLIGLANDTLRKAYGPGAESGEILQEFIDRAAGLHSTGRSPDAVMLEAALHEVYEDAMSGGVPMMPFPFGFINDYLGGGAADGEFIIVAGWPSHGKSAFIKQCAAYFTSKGYAGGLVTLEESRKKIARNLLSSESGIPNKAIRRGITSANDSVQMMEAISRLAPRKLYIHERAVTLAQIVTAIDIGVARQGWKWAMIDHLDLVDIGAVGDADGNTAKHSHLSKTIKHTARRLNIPILAVKQLKKRGTTIRKPGPDDLRETGAYHADCDVMIFVDSDDVHHREDSNWQESGLTDLIVSKAREGTGGLRKVKWCGRTQQYREQHEDHATAAPNYHDPFQEG